MKNYFRPQRLWLLLKRDFFIQYKTYVVALAAMFSVLFVVNIATVAGAQSWSFHLVFYPLTLFIGGYIFTGLSFNELADERGRIFYMSIPATILEKLLSKLLISGAGYVVVSLLLYTVFSLVVAGLTTLFFSTSHQVFNPFQGWVVDGIFTYLMTQPLFLTGALYFRRNVVLKSILAAFITSLAFIAFTALTIYFVQSALTINREVFVAYEIFSLAEDSALYKELAGFCHIAGSVFHTAFHIFLPPVLLAVSYYRLKELEV